MSTLQLKVMNGKGPDSDTPRVPGAYTIWNAHQVIDRYLQPQGDLSLDQAFFLLDKMLPKQDPDPNYLSDVEMLSIQLGKIPGQIPYWHPAQGKLLRLIQRLVKSPKFHTLYSTEEHPTLKYSFYNRMEDFGKEVYDGCYDSFFGGPEVDEPMNYHAFFARLVSAGIEANGTGTGVYFLRYALEREEDEFFDQDGTYLHDLAKTASLVAAVWILCAGQHLLNEIAIYPQDVPELHLDDYVPGKLYSGPMFGRQRWAFWQRRFLQRCDDDSFDDEVRQLSKRAADFMAALATNVLW